MNVLNKVVKSGVFLLLFTAKDVKKQGARLAHLVKWGVKVNG